MRVNFSWSVRKKASGTSVLSLGEHWHGGCFGVLKPRRIFRGLCFVRGDRASLKKPTGCVKTLLRPASRAGRSAVVVSIYSRGKTEMNKTLLSTVLVAAMAAVAFAPTAQAVPPAAPSPSTAKSRHRLARSTSALRISPYSPADRGLPAPWHGRCGRRQHPVQRRVERLRLSLLPATSAPDFTRYQRAGQWLFEKHRSHQWRRRCSC